MENETRNIPLTDITQDPRLQPRAALDAETVADYATRYAEGADMPAVTLFHDGAVYFLADGFHRIAAAEKAGLDAIPADVRDGTFRDALLFAAGANAGHGLRRTNADKRRAVQMLLADPVCAEWSDNQIAKHCGVSQPMATATRAIFKNFEDAPPGHLDESSRGGEAEYPGELPDTGSATPAARTVTRKGVTYTMNTRNIGRRSALAPEADARKKIPIVVPGNDFGLLPCPLCGDADMKFADSTDGQHRMAHCQNPGCAVIGPRRASYDEARLAWNRRT